MDLTESIAPRSQFGMVRRPAIDRFADKIALTESGCIEWLGGMNGSGYGQFYRGKDFVGDTGKTYAHRWSYEYHVGPIPAGHAYAGRNLYVHPTKGQRVCRECGRLRALAKRVSASRARKAA